MSELNSHSLQDYDPLRVEEIASIMRMSSRYRLLGDEAVRRLFAHRIDMKPVGLPSQQDIAEAEQILVHRNKQVNDTKL